MLPRAQHIYFATVERKGMIELHVSVHKERVERLCCCSMRYPVSEGVVKRIEKHMSYAQRVSV